MCVPPGVDSADFPPCRALPTDGTSLRVVDGPADAAISMVGERPHARLWTLLTGLWTLPANPTVRQ